MCKVLFFSDIHFYSGFTEFAKPDNEYHNSRFKVQIDLLEQILKRAQADSLPVIFGGDLFHVRQKVSIFDFNMVYQTFAKYQDVDIVFLRGNHDSVTNLMGSSSALDTFAYLPNIRVVSNPEHFNFHGIELYCMPYGEDLPTIKATLKRFADDAVKQTKPTMLIAHLEVNGCILVGKQRSETSLTLADFYTDDYSCLMFGHIHHRQSLAPNAKYVGSTLQNSFSDGDQPKGYDILSLHNDRTVEDEFVDGGTPRFITAHEWTDKVKQLVDDGNYVRLQADPKAIQKLQDDGKIDTNVRTEPIKQFDLNKRLDIEATDTPLQVTAKYLADKGLPVLNEAKEILKSL